MLRRQDHWYSFLDRFVANVFMAYYCPAVSTFSGINVSSDWACKRVASVASYFLEEHMQNGISPTAVAIVAAPITQLESQHTMPLIVLIITAVVGNYVSSREMP